MAYGPEMGSPTLNCSYCSYWAAAQAFFRSAQAVTGVTLDRVGHDSYPRTIRTTLGKGGRHRTSAYLNNRNSSAAP